MALCALAVTLGTGCGSDNGSAPVPPGTGGKPISPGTGGASVSPGTGDTPVSPDAGPADADGGAGSALGRAIAALGSESAFAGLRTLTVEASGSSTAYDEGPEPGGVPFTASSDFKSTASFDLASTGRWKITYERAYKLIRPGTMAKYDEIIVDKIGTIVGDERVTGGTPNFVGKMSSARLGSIKRHQAFLHPHLLVKRLAAADVTDAGSGSASGKTLRRLLVRDPDQVSEIELGIDEATGRIASATTKESDPLRGDVLLRFAYDGWEASGALFFPRKVTVELDGTPVRIEERTGFMVNPTLADALFAFPSMDNAAHDPKEEVKGHKNAMSFQRYANMGVGASQDFPKGNVVGQEIGAAGSGIWHLVGASHHSLLVDQGKTVVLVDAPNDAARSKALLDWIDAKLPGGLAENQVSHVILTHHHVDHSAGLRTFVARGAAAVVAQPALTLWQKLLATPRTIDPDELSAKPVAAPNLIAVKAGEPFSLGTVNAHHVMNRHSNDTLVIHVAPAGAAPVLFVTDIYLPSLTAILPKSNFVVWSKDLDDALVALGLAVPTLQIVGGHGNVDAMGKHFVVTYPMFKAQLTTAMAP